MTTRQRCGCGRWLADLSAFSVIWIVWSRSFLCEPAAERERSSASVSTIQGGRRSGVELSFVMVAGELTSVLLVPSPLASRVCRATTQSVALVTFPPARACVQ